ncbi:MAG: hypothetical protein IPO37_09965 [Saprospiraceae bacterium]|nr:hypothetical protein [Saprospiraceae bacterium]
MPVKLCLIVVLPWLCHEHQQCVRSKTIFTGCAKAAVWGAVSGAVTFGIGEVAKTIGSVYLRFYFRHTLMGFTMVSPVSLREGASLSMGLRAVLSVLAAATFAGDATSRACGTDPGRRRERRTGCRDQRR